jgi:hypothetical protein
VSQFIESSAERLDPVQAAELARVLDLQSRWENMRADCGDSTTRLQSLQRAFEAYRVRLTEYKTRHRSHEIPDQSPSSPDRLGAWCRMVRVLFTRAAEGNECPAQVVTKAWRLADRIAARAKLEPVGRESPAGNMAEAIRQLDVLIAWCDMQVAPRPLWPQKGGAVYEVGDGIA